MGIKKCVEWGFGYGESEYEVSSGTELRFDLPAKFGVGKSKLEAPEYIYPEIKGRWLN